MGFFLDTLSLDMIVIVKGSGLPFPTTLQYYPAYGKQRYRTDGYTPQTLCLCCLTSRHIPTKESCNLKDTPSELPASGSNYQPTFVQRFGTDETRIRIHQFKLQIINPGLKLDFLQSLLISLIGLF